MTDTTTRTDQKILDSRASRVSARPASTSTKTSGRSRGALSSSIDRVQIGDLQGHVDARPAVVKTKTDRTTRGASSSIGPLSVEDRTQYANARPAVSQTKTDRTTRGALSDSISRPGFGDQKTNADATRLAISVAKTNNNSRGASPIAGHGDDDNHKDYASTRPATNVAKTAQRSRGVPSNGAGHTVADNLQCDAGARPAIDLAKTRMGSRGDEIGDDHEPFADQSVNVVADLRYSGAGPLGAAVPPIIFNYRFYKDYETSEYRESNHALAICRRQCSGTKEEKKVAAVVLLKRLREGVIENEQEQQLANVVNQFARIAKECAGQKGEYQKRLEALAKQLPKPVLDFQESVKGFGLFSLAKLVAECGDIGVYRTACGLRKRCGLAPYKDKAMSTHRRDGGLSDKEWIMMGYAPRRRSAMAVIATSIAGAGQIRPVRLTPDAPLDGLTKYQKIYYAHLRRLVERDPEHARTVSATGKESFSKHADLQASRVMMQKFLNDLFGVCKGLR